MLHVKSVYSEKFIKEREAVSEWRLLIFLSILEFAHVIGKGKITSTMYTIRITYVMHTKKYYIVIFIYNRYNRARNKAKEQGRLKNYSKLNQIKLIIKLYVNYTLSYLININFNVCIN